VFVKPKDLANFPTEPSSSPELPDQRFAPPWPFKNMLKYLLMNWYHSGSTQKMAQEITKLATDIIGAPDF
jgi:hypothetical protein